MSIASKIAGALTAKPAVAVTAVHEAQALLDRISSEVKSENDRIADIQGGLADAALAAFASDVDEARYNELLASLETANARLAKMQSAHASATQRLSDAKRAQLLEANAEYRRTLKRLSNQRQKIAGELAAAVETVAKHWTDLHRVNEKLRLSFPGGGDFPLGAMLRPGELFRALETELYRINAEPKLPGARCVDLRLLQLPEQLPAFVDEVSRGNDYLLRLLSGEEIEPPAAPVDPLAELFTSLGPEERQ